jgi:hypothetical protein
MRAEGKGARTARVGGFPTGTDLGGIRCIEDLRLRCRIVEGDDCWHWAGAFDTKKNLPKLWFPLFGTTTTPGPVIAFLKTGCRPKKSRWLSRCGSGDCVNPDHWAVSSHAEACRRRPRKNTAVGDYRATLARRARAKLDDASAADIRAREHGAQHYADKYGVGLNTVYRVWKGQMWKPMASPVNSVFALASAMGAV